jgi:hypothetical protein
VQLGDHRGTRQPEERVDLPLDLQRRHAGLVRVLPRELVERLLRPLVVGLATEREAQVIEIAVAVVRPDLIDDHGDVPVGGCAAIIARRFS